MKHEINDLLARFQFQDVYSRFREEQDKFEFYLHKNFAGIKRLIDIHREELKIKIDEIALAMVEKIENFSQKLIEASRFEEFEYEKEKDSLEAEFRKLNIKI